MEQEPDLNSSSQAMEELHSYLPPQQFSYLLSVLYPSQTPQTLSFSDISPSSGSSQLDGSRSSSSNFRRELSPSHFSTKISPQDFSMPKLKGRLIRQQRFVETHIKLTKVPEMQSKDSSLIQKNNCHPDFVVSSEHTLDARSQKSILLKKYVKKPSYRPSLTTDDASSEAFKGLQESEPAVLSQESLNVDLGRRNMLARSSKDDNFPLLMLEPPTVHFREASSVTLCSHMPVCKRTLHKLSLGKERELSRSSSMETVKAETLPDIDNPYEDVAGRVANEPVNPFPVLKEPNSNGKAQRDRRKSSLLDYNRLEKEVDNMFAKFEDYTNVSTFFNGGGERHFGYDVQVGKPRQDYGRRGAYSLNHRESNPLYKDYKYEGYTKSEDELALDCIQMICNDFNTWIASLDDDNSSNEASKDEEKMVESKEMSNSRPFMESEFLIQILRKDLELPDNIIY